MTKERVGITVFKNDDGVRIGQFLMSDYSKLTGRGIEFTEMNVIGLANFSQDCTEEVAYKMMEEFIQNVSGPCTLPR